LTKMSNGLITTSFFEDTCDMFVVEHARWTLAI
jgi:hypothetical protein